MTFHHHVCELTRYKLSHDGLGEGGERERTRVRTKIVSVVGQRTMNNMKTSIFLDKNVHVLETVCCGCRVDM